MEYSHIFQQVTFNDQPTYLKRNVLSLMIERTVFPFIY
jgi:hypothetical protein